jgi:flagellar biosynthesis/type III secretory pathway M-ring protein FliF/YscJ
MEAFEKLLDIVGKILLVGVILWVIIVKIILKIWKNLTSLPK